MEPLVSIIIINYNGYKHLKECFNSLQELNYKNIEIIFVDNGSKDNSVEFVRKYYGNTKIIQLDKNYGFAKPNNIGAAQSKGDYIVLLNNDTIVDKNWLTELIKVAKSSDEIGIVGSKLYLYYDKNLLNFAGNCCNKYLRTFNIGENKRDHQLFNIQRETFCVWGAALLIKREVYKKLGLFDSKYFAYKEDLDLCWRAWIFGYKVLYVPKSFLYHKVGQTLKGQNEFKSFLGEKNMLRTLLKNYELKTILKIMPVYIGKRIGVLIRYTLNLDKSSLSFLTIYNKVIFWNIVHIRSLLKYRKFIQTNRKKDDKFLLALMDRFIKLEQALRTI